MRSKAIYLVDLKKQIALLFVGMYIFKAKIHKKICDTIYTIMEKRK